MRWPLEVVSRRDAAAREAAGRHPVDLFAGVPFLVKDLFPELAGEGCIRGCHALWDADPGAAGIVPVAGANDGVNRSASWPRTPGCSGSSRDGGVPPSVQCSPRGCTVLRFIV